MNKEEVTLSKLQGLLEATESNFKDKSVAPLPIRMLLCVAY